MENLNTQGQDNSSLGPKQESEVTIREDMRITTNGGIHGGIVFVNSNGHAEALPTARKGPLSEAHKKELAASGIAADVAKILGIKTVTGWELEKYGWSGPILQSREEFLLFPYFDPWGEPQTWKDKQGNEFPFARLKKPKAWAEKGGKYLQPEGSGQHLYIPSRLDGDYWKVLGETEDGDELAYPEQRDIRVTEGEKKTICSHLHTGVLTLGLGGVNSYKAPYLFEYFMASQSFQICFDNDIWTKHKIEKALNAAGNWLIRPVVLSIEANLCTEDEEARSDLRKIAITHIPHVDGLKNLRDLSDISNDNLLPRISKLVYTLLPLHPQGEKLGIDDWLVGQKAQKKTLARNILNAKIPLVNKKAEARIHKLWQKSDQKRDIAVNTYGKDKKGKPTIKKETLPLGTIDKEPSRDLCAHLACATADMGKATIGDEMPYVWEDRVWGLATTPRLDSQLGKIRNSYGFFNGNCGISKLTSEEFNIWGRRPLPNPVFLGLKDCDLNMQTGDQVAIDPNNFVMARSKHGIEQGEPTQFLRALSEMLEDQVELFRAAVRTSFAPNHRVVNTPQALFYILGEPGCGKGAIMDILAQCLPGCSPMPLTDIIQASDAAAMMIPVNKMGQLLVYDPDFKSNRKLTSTDVKTLNMLVDRLDATYKTMGKDKFNAPVTFRYFVLANKPPKISSVDSDGVYRRLVILKCQNKRRQNADPDWPHKIAKEEGGRILNWVFGLSLEEAARTVQGRLNQGMDPREMQALKEQEHEDVVIWAEGIWDQHEVGMHSELMHESAMQKYSMAPLPDYPEVEYWVHSDYAYTHYKEWCGQSRRTARTRTNFLAALEEARLGVVPRDKQGRVNRRQLQMPNGEKLRARPIELIQPGLEDIED